MFRALADETRREILGLLQHGWPTISRHLAILREAGLVNAERNGQEIRYELNTSIFEDLIQHVMMWTKRPREHRAAHPQRARESEA